MRYQPLTTGGEGGPVPRSITDASADRTLTLAPPIPEDAGLVATLLDLPAGADRPDEVVGGWGDHWQEHGFGTWVVRDSSDRPVGFVGLDDQEDFIRLTTRFVDGVEEGAIIRALRLVTAHAMEWLPDMPVRLRLRPSESGARRVAEAAGLQHVPDLDHGSGDEAWEVLELAYVRTFDRVPERAREAMVDMWVQVNDTGGAVGFRPGTGRSRVAAVLDGYIERMATGTTVGVALNSPLGELRGFGFVVGFSSDLLAHGGNLERIMTDTDHRGTNHGSLLMAGLHRTARERGIEMLTLDYRGGTGLGEFYTKYGYREVGRIPRALRVAEGDDRDGVIMSRSL